MSEAVKPQENNDKIVDENEASSESVQDSAIETEQFEEQVEVPVEPEKEEVDYEAVIEELNDRVLRTAAELQNVKRRAEQDVKKARDYSIESFAKDMLSVMDNLNRATDSISPEDAEKDERLKRILDGVEITKKEMTNVFERNYIKCVDPVGEKFDHNYHQAMSQIEDAEKEPGTVVNVMQTGYTIKDRLIRPALVVVVK